MKVSRSLRCLVGITVTMGIAFACSNDPTTAPSNLDGPAFLGVSVVSLGQGDVLDGGSSELACDQTVAVSLSVDTNWKLRPPGTCDVTQCGRVRLELSDASRNYVRVQESANVGVTFSIVPYDVVTIEDDGGTTTVTHTPTSGTYTLTVDFIDDAGNPYNPGDGGKGSVQVSFQLDLPTNCDPDGNAGAGGSRATAEGGAAGLAGIAGESTSAGAAGESTGGSGGSTGMAGFSGTSGTGGAAPAAGAAGE